MDDVSVPREPLTTLGRVADVLTPFEAAPKVGLRAAVALTILGTAAGFGLMADAIVGSGEIPIPAAGDAPEFNVCGGPTALAA